MENKRLFQHYICPYLRDLRLHIYFLGIKASGTSLQFIRYIFKEYQTLRQYGYPPDMQKMVIETVLKQTEMITNELTQEK